jgi:hypothetical protein
MSNSLLKALAILPQVKEKGVRTPYQYTQLHQRSPHDLNYVNSKNLIELKIERFSLSQTEGDTDNSRHILKYCSDNPNITDLSFLHFRGTHIGPVNTVLAIAKALKKQGRNITKVGLSITHPDIFEWIASSKKFAELGIDNFIICDTSWIHKIRNDTPIVLKNLRTHDQKKVVPDQIKTEWSDCIYKRITGPDLAVFDTNKIFSHSVGQFIGEVDRDKIFISAQKLLIFVSYNIRMNGFPKIIWSNFGRVQMQLINAELN